MPRLPKGLAIGLTAVAVLWLIWLFIPSSSPETTANFDQGTIRRGDVRAVVSATGTLNPVNTVQVGSQVSGSIQGLSADFNDQVKQGQVIAQIDPAIFRAKLAEAQANLLSAEAARDKALLTVSETQREYERQAGLFEKRLSAESALSTAQYNYQAAQVELQARQASVAQAKAMLQREQVNLDYSTIRAPIDGVVISRDVELGQTVAASLQAPVLFKIANDLTRMQVEADVDEAFIGEVQQRQPVEFTVFAYPSRRFEGLVTQVRLQPKVESGVVKYNCIIQVDNADLALKPGMTATLNIEVERQQQVLKVPNAALRYVPPLAEQELAQMRRGLKPQQAILWQIGEREQLIPRIVQTGVIGEKQTEVSGAEIAEGMSIALPLEGKRHRRSQRRFSLSLF